MRRTLRQMWVAGLVLLSTVEPAVAGSLEQTSSAFCDWRLTGPLDADDTNSLDEIPADPEGTTLCLDATEGDLAAGLALLQQIRTQNIRTRVLPGHRCEGACALVLLGGVTAVGAGDARFPHREIWAGARVGFSASGDSSDQSFDVVAGLFEIKATQEMGHRLLEDHLFLQLLRHRGDTSYVIDSVGDAYLSNLPVMGVAAPAPVIADHIGHVCDAVYLRHRLYDGTAGPLDADVLSTAHALASLRANRAIPLQTTIQTDPETDTLFGYAGPYWAGSQYWQRECHVTVRPSDVAAYGGENAALGITGVAVEFRDYGGPVRDMTRFDPETWTNATRLVGAYDVPPVLMYPYHWRLEDLPATSQAVAARAEGGPVLPPPAPTFARFDGMDLAGGDLQSLPVESAAACRQACQSTPGCDSATHDLWNGVCFLKSLDQSSARLSRHPKSDVYVAGPRLDDIQPAQTPPVILRRDGKGFFDQPNDYYQSTDFEGCARQCLADPACNGFNFRAETGACQVFERPGEYFDRNGSAAGLKVQPL
ncbi:MAG: PAN domain-containing protein [Pseudomonadota bacterium]